MNENKICFVVVVNDEDIYSRCKSFIKKINLPYDFETEIFPIRNVTSIASAYNQAIKSSDAKYKVYLHEDVLIVNKNLVYDMLKIFSDKTIGMIGVAGSKQLPVSGKWWESKTAYGEFYDTLSGQIRLEKFKDIKDDYEIVQSIDNLIMITQYDIRWREDLFDGYHFYEASQSLEFKNADYKVVVPKQPRVWCLHNRTRKNNNEDFEHYREIFLKNYNLLDLNSNQLFEFDRDKALTIMNDNLNFYNSNMEVVKQNLEQGNYEIVSRLIHNIASHIFEHHPGFFVSKEIEDILKECANNLPINNNNFEFKKSNKRNILHVLSEGYSTGGHTRLVKHWIKSDPNSTHHLVTTWQKGTTPKWLTDEIEKSGGSVITLETINEFTKKSAALREIAYNLADIVVLHVHMFDPIANMAFGVDGGPPIIFLNHGDHCFWIGSSIADIVVDVSESGNKLTKTRRGANKSFILPIPINFNESNLDKKKIREKYNIKDTTKVLLTIASEYKFESVNDIDYCEIAKTLINNTEDTILIVVGPRNIGKWNTLFKVTDGRVMPLGVLDNIDEFYKVADLYLEPFMMASYTSRLDAILNGLPSIKLKNKLYPKITDLFKELELLSCDNISDLISCINSFENNEDNEIFKKGIMMKDFVLRENINNTNAYIEKIYNSVDKHLVSEINVSNDIDDYDLFWALFNSR